MNATSSNPNEALPAVSVSSTVDGLSAARLASLNVQDAWALSGQEGAQFGKLVNRLITEFADEHDIYLPDQERMILRSRLGPMFRANGNDLLTVIVHQAMVPMLNPAPVTREAIGAYNAVRSCKDKSSVCHAPSTSMYFGRDGFVSACCYTRARPFGRYPDDGIADLWFGERIERMRQPLRHNQLPDCCWKCADQLRAHNFEGLLAASFDGFAPSPGLSKLKRAVGMTPEKVYPVCLEFELSNKCNLECTMCSGFCSSSIRANRENLPALPQLYDSRFVEQLVPFIPHLQQARFFGGEPFLVDLYYEIWELFIESNPSCEIFITSNGTVFTPKVQRVLEKLNCRITVSVDSIDKQKYEAIRKNAKLETTLANVEKFRAINERLGRKMTLNVCPMVSNWEGIPDIIAWANARGIYVFFTTVTYPENESLKYMAAAVQERVVDSLRRGLGKAKNRIEAANFRALGDLSQQVETWMAEGASVQPATFAIL
jgi:MoaA/NifB/PqqE/SkfB family radical SAM enzyme